MLQRRGTAADALGRVDFITRSWKFLESTARALRARLRHLSNCRNELGRERERDKEGNKERGGET